MAANDIFWGFVFYIQNNQWKGPGGMTNDDITNMANLFADANSTEITDATQPGGTFTDVEWPDASGGASSITAIATEASIRRAQFPEKHRGA